MKKMLFVILAFILCIGAISVPAVAADYATFNLKIKDNGDGTATVTAYAPAGAFSGKIVIDTTSDLTYIPGSAVCEGVLNEEYNKNGVSGVCVAFAFHTALRQDTVVFTAKYNITVGADITAEDIYSEEWNLTNGSEFIANQNDGPVDVEYELNTYNVKFYGFDSDLLKEETVVAGASATAPAAPVVEGHDFIGWDKEFTSITSDLEVTAVYEIKTFTVTFVAGEGLSIIGNTTATVPYGTKFDDLPFPECEITSDNADSYRWTRPAGFDYDKGVTEDISVYAALDHIMGPRPPVTMGDVNNDGYVDNIDASIILKYDAGLIVLIDYYLEYGGDVNGDLYIDNIDASLILKYDAGLISGF